MNIDLVLLLELLLEFFDSYTKWSQSPRTLNLVEVIGKDYWGRPSWGLVLTSDLRVRLNGLGRVHGLSAGPVMHYIYESGWFHGLSSGRVRLGLVSSLVRKKREKKAQSKTLLCHRTQGAVMPWWNSEFANGRSIFLSILGLIGKLVIKPSVGVGAGSWRDM